ncbi:MAG: DsbA family protein, partial [Actinomycetota bacterium]|nr:DsbA family protein [Actinomycetota bacterium]
DVEMVDLDRLPRGRMTPEGLVGTPTYVLDGQVRWLGNPSPGELLTAWDEDTGHESRSLARRSTAGCELRR